MFILHPPCILQMVAGASYALIFAAEIFQYIHPTMYWEEPLPVKAGEQNPCYEHKCHLPAVSWEPKEVKQPIMVKQNIPENRFPNNKQAKC